MLQLRSADGKVLVAPAWDYRPAASQALPLQMRVPSRALERVLQYWTKHGLPVPPPCLPVLVLTPWMSGAPYMPAQLPLVPENARLLKTRSPLATTASARLPRPALRCLPMPMLLHPV